MASGGIPGGDTPSFQFHSYHGNEAASKLRESVSQRSTYEVIKESPAFTGLADQKQEVAFFKTAQALASTVRGEFTPSRGVGVLPPISDEASHSWLVKAQELKSDLESGDLNRCLIGKDLQEFATQMAKGEKVNLASNSDVVADTVITFTDAEKKALMTFIENLFGESREDLEAMIEQSESQIGWCDHSIDRADVLNERESPLLQEAEGNLETNIESNMSAAEARVEEKKQDGRSPLQHLS